MKDFRSREKKIRPILHRPVTAVLLFLLVVILTRSVYASYTKKKIANTEQQKFIQKYENLLKKKEQLQDKIDRLHTEEGIIEEYKKRFDVVEPGEKIIRIVE